MSERIMEENSMVRDLITKILDETGPTEGISPSNSSNSSVGVGPSNNQLNLSGNTSFLPPTFNSYPEQSFNYPPTENGYNFNGFTNSIYPDNDVNSLFAVDMSDNNDVTPEQLNLLRLAAQEIGGAQFTSPNSKFDYNFFEPNQRNSLTDNMFSNFRPNGVNMDSVNFPSLDNFNNVPRFPNKFSEFPKDTQNGQESDILSYLSQLNMNLDRPRDDLLQNNIGDFKMPLEMNGHFQNEDHFKTPEDRNKMLFNRNYQMPPNKFNGEFFLSDMMKNMSTNDKSFPMGQNFEFNQNQGSNFKNGFHQSDFSRRDFNQMTPRDGYQVNGNNENRGFDTMNRDNLQQAALKRQNQELARQMNLLMRNRPPPNPLNVDVSFVHENAPFNMGIGGIMAPNTSIPPPVIASPMLDVPLLAPFYAMRNMRAPHSLSSILHARLDACYEQWRQLERERKRTEARLALAFPGRAVSSSNSIPVPRLPPCPTRVDRLTVDMLREHTKVLTLMGKMETLRASVCVANNKKPNKQEDSKITVLKRGQENVPIEKVKEVDPNTFDPSSWKEDIKNLAEIAPHSEVESAMLQWRAAVGLVQTARRRELAGRTDGGAALSSAVKTLTTAARRARCAMWCDLTITVCMAPASRTLPASDTTQSPTQSISHKQSVPEVTNTTSEAAKPAENTEEKPATESSTKQEAKPAETNTKTTTKQTDKQDKQRRTQNYRHKVNQGNKNDFYQKNQRYDNRFMHNRHPYHYLATGPIN